MEKEPEKDEIIIAFWRGAKFGARTNVYLTSHYHWFRSGCEYVIGDNCIEIEVGSVWEAKDARDVWRPQLVECIDGKWGMPSDYSLEYTEFIKKNSMKAINISSFLIGQNKEGCECGVWAVGGFHSSYCKLYSEDKDPRIIYGSNGYEE